jgi:hypothetical protein
VNVRRVAVRSSAWLGRRVPLTSIFGTRRSKCDWDLHVRSSGSWLEMPLLEFAQCKSVQSRITGALCDSRRGNFAALVDVYDNNATGGFRIADPAKILRVRSSDAEQEEEQCDDSHDLTRPS